MGTLQDPHIFLAPHEEAILKSPESYRFEAFFGSAEKARFPCNSFQEAVNCSTQYEDKVGIMIYAVAGGMGCLVAARARGKWKTAKGLEINLNEGVNNG